MAYASAEDVAVRLARSFTGEEVGLVEVRLEDAERMIRRRIPDLDNRVRAGTIEVEDVIYVEAEAVCRVARNPDGFTSETDGNYTYQLPTQLATARLQILPEEWLILGVTNSRMSTLVPSVLLGNDQDRLNVTPVLTPLEPVADPVEPEVTDLTEAEVRALIEAAVSPVREDVAGLSGQIADLVDAVAALSAGGTLSGVTVDAAGLAALEQRLNDLENNHPLMWSQDVYNVQQALEVYKTANDALLAGKADKTALSQASTFWGNQLTNLQTDFAGLESEIGRWAPKLEADVQSKASKVDLDAYKLANDAEVAKKADKTQLGVNSQGVALATKMELDDRLVDKADKTEVAVKADQSLVDTVLSDLAGVAQTASGSEESLLKLQADFQRLLDTLGQRNPGFGTIDSVKQFMTTLEQVITSIGETIEINRVDSLDTDTQIVDFVNVTFTPLTEFQGLLDALNGPDATVATVQQMFWLLNDVVESLIQATGIQLPKDGG